MEPLPTPPPELKALTPWITRGNELLKADPIIAYWCTFYAAQQGISSKPQGKESKELLMQVLDSLEARKAALGQEPAVTDDAAGKAYVENFALKVFVGADNEDRAGKATRATAKKFIAAGNFLDLLKLFDQLPQHIEEKIKYAKWKAGDIAKAFREGRQPAPGPPGGLEGEPPVEAEAEAALLGGSSKEEDDYVAREMAKLMDNTSVPQDNNGVAPGPGKQVDAGEPRAITPPNAPVDAASATAGGDERPGHARSPSMARRKAQLSLSSSPAAAGSTNFSMPLRHPVSRETSTDNIFDAPYSAPGPAQQPTLNGLPSINTPPATAGDFSSGHFSRSRPASVIGIEGFFPGGVGLGGNTGGGSNRPLPTPPPRDGLPIPPGPPNANIPPNQRPPSASMFLQHHNRSNQGSPNMQGSLPLPPSGLPPPSLGSPYTLPQFISSSRSTSQNAIPTAQTQPSTATHATQQPRHQPSAPALPPAPPAHGIAPSLPANGIPGAPSAPSHPVVPSAPPAASVPPPLAPSGPVLPPAANVAPMRTPAPPPAPAPAAVATPLPAAAAPASTLPESLPANLSARVQKLTKFAASALDYDDLDTARKQLREALDICEGRITK